MTGGVHLKGLVRCLIGLLFVTNVPVNVSADSDSGDYYPQVVDRRSPTHETLDLRTSVDGPAGEHGFLENRDGSLVFEDGTNVRFWGVNIAARAAFPDKKTAERTAGILDFYGFNFVRFHHLDTAFEPGGIFENVDKAQKGIDDRRTGVLSERQLARLDYFIYQLRQRGIYTDLNLLSGRKFTKADGVRAADELRALSHQAAKPVSLFDPHLIDLQKKYAMSLLRHTNPYTQLAYADDPAIAFVEITNENALLRYWVNGTLDGSVAGIGRSLPDFYTDQLDTLWDDWRSRQQYSGNDPGVKRVGWKFRQASSDAAVDQTISFYAELERIYYAEMTRYLHEDVGSKALVTASGSYFSLANLQSQAVADFTSPHYYWDVLRWADQPRNLQRFSIANLSILRDPQANGRPMRNPIADMGIQQVVGKPMIIMEWNQAFPNAFGYELPMIIAAYGSLQGWDGAAVFSYKNTAAKGSTNERIDHFNEIHANPQKLVVNALAALIFRRGYISPSSQPLVLELSDAEVVRNVRTWGTRRRENPNWKFDEQNYLQHGVAVAFVDQLKIPQQSGTRSPSVSDTAELTWDKQRGLLLVDTPRVKGVMGALAGAGSLELTGGSMSSRDDGMVFVVSLDGRALETSARMLVVCVGNVTNTGANWAGATKDWGKGPVLMQRVRGEFDLNMNGGGRLIPLDFRGYPAEDSDAIQVAESRIHCPENAPWAVLERE